MLVSVLNQECIDQMIERPEYTWALGNQRLLNVIGICTFLFLSLFFVWFLLLLFHFIFCVCVCVCFVCFWFNFFDLASDLQDLSSPTRDQNRARAVDL